MKGMLIILCTAENMTQKKAEYVLDGKEIQHKHMYRNTKCAFI